jgi:hypothetical protein
VTHPFHPLVGRDFEFVVHRQKWGEDRVHLHDGGAVLAAGGMDGRGGVGPVCGDRRGSVPVHDDGLLGLADLIDRLRLDREVVLFVEV